MGDGLEVIGKDEVDTICLAGIGPRTIANILTAGVPLLAGKPVRLVLNPLCGSRQPRAFLAEHGFELVVDTEVLDRGRRYEILVAERDR